MIWSTSYHHVTVLVHRSWLHLLFTVAFVHRRQVLLKLHRHAVHCSKAFTCPSHLQSIQQAKSCLDLLHFSHMTPCHVSYAISSIITCVSYATYPSHFTSMAWVLLTQVFLWTNLLCKSLNHTLVHLGCHSITKTKQRPFIIAIAQVSGFPFHDPCWIPLLKCMYNKYFLLYI